MLFTVKEDLALIRELKINVNQLMFVKMLVRDFSKSEREWAKESYAMSLEFQHLCPLSAEELMDLLQRDIIINLNDNKGKILYSDFEINPKYQRKFVLKVTGMPTELCDAYPYEIDNNQFKFFARNISAEDVAKTYLKAINNNREEHEEILKDIKWAVENRALPVGLKAFVESKYWIHIRMLRIKSPAKSLGDVELG